MDDFALLARLVAFDTTSCHSNVALADFVAEYAARAGARVERNPSPDGAKTNLVVRFGPDADDRSGLALSGHMDVVPAGCGWSSDPFTLTDGGDRFFGRGTCDMKGFLAVALNVACEARDLKHPLVLVYTYDEELGTLGAKHLVESWAGVEGLPRSAIIGEPTSLRVVRMHKGHLKLRVVLHGVSAHSGYPHLGRNAIELAARVLVSLRGLRHRLEQAGGPNADAFPEVPYAPLNIGTIHGGVAINVVPDRCEIELGVRALPGMDDEALNVAIRDAVANAVAGENVEFEILSRSPPMLLGEDTPIHRGLCAIAHQESSCSVSFATDAGWLSTKAGMECAIFGPGTIEVAHKPDEYVPKAELAQARDALRQAVARFCG